MTKKIAFLAVAALMSATPALAQTVCVEPAPPAMVDGGSVARPQLAAAVAQVRDFINKSDAYQQCIADDLEAKKQAATKAGTPFDEQVHQVAMAKVAANQQLKDKLASDINTQIAIFKQKNPQ